MPNGNGSIPSWLSAITGAIRDVGFPIAVTAFLLWMLVPILRELRDNVKEIKWMVAQHTGISTHPPGGK